ncbi:MAG: SEC-C metal-binding domain-containing protein, partial [Acidimicrobiales bacterium]
VHHLQQALRAEELYKRDKDYIIRDGEVKIVDEFTGRVLDGRRWSEGLHQAVEAKEGVSIKEENQTLATVTLQNYFRLYEKLAGMTGTAETEASELMGTYGLQVVPIPSNKPLARDDKADLIYKSEQAKFGAIVDDLSGRHETGQPVLVGTVSVENSEKLSRVLEQRGIPHSVLNAKQHTNEAQIVTQAGRVGSVTVATNMAGRGVDIVLGGNAEGLAENEVLAAGLSMDDEEGKELYVKELSKYEPECKVEGDKVRELGGLYVLATERHDSRRIDNQLRGRSGRQGDPGESRFYLSLEDDLMRLFATGAMDWVMGRALPEEEAIEAKMVSKAIERAQTTVEQKNAEVRKNVLKYDEVMNEQRKVIYKRRDQILDGADLREEAMQYLADAVDSLVSAHAVSDHADEWDLDTLLTEVATYWPTELSEEALAEATTTDGLYEMLMSEATAHYEQRETEIGDDIMRQVERQVMLQIIDQRWREHLYEMDYLREGIHLRAMGQKDPATEWQREGFEMFGHMMTGIAQDFVKYVMHVQVNVSEPAPKPTQQAVDVTETAPDSQAERAGQTGSSALSAPKKQAELGGGDGPEIVEENKAASRTPKISTQFEKAGRNEPCPCGSGKKFKTCHGKK